MRVGSDIRAALLATSIAGLGLLVGCSRTTEEDGYSPEVKALLYQGHDLWKSGNTDYAIQKYAEIIQVDPTNPYGHFGLGMESSQGLINGPEVELLSIANTNLRRYLDSPADRGGGTEAERRNAAETALRRIAERLARAKDDEDGYDLHEGLRRFKKGNRWGFADARGTTVIQPAFDFVRNFNQGLAPAKKGALWGYITPDGKFAIKPQFEDAGGFDHGIAWVRPVGAESGFRRSINKRGEFAVDPKYSDAPSEPSARTSGGRSGKTIVGTFSGEEGGGSIIRATFNADGTFEVSQRGEKAGGTYKRFKMPHPEKGGDNVYYKLEMTDNAPDGSPYKPQIGFYSPSFDKFYFVVDGGRAEERFLKVGPHPEPAVDLTRER